MRIVIQRVSSAQVTVDNKIIAAIKKGYLLLVGIEKSDTAAVVRRAAEKVVKLRLFEDDYDKTNLNLKAVDGEILSVSQFTLLAKTDKGNRPSFIEAMPPKPANELFERFNRNLRLEGIQVSSGQFGAHMQIELTNDGPFTILLHIKATD